MKYESLVAAGIRHEDLFYNLGNAYYQAARAGRRDALGRAIWCYERALRLDPGFADAHYNLAVAREAVAAKVVDRLKGAERDPLWIRAVTFFSIAQLTWVVLGLDLLFFGALIVLRFLSSGFTRTVVLVGDVFVGVAGLGFAVLLAGHVYFVENVPLGIVLADKTAMYEGPDPKRAERGQVHAGLRVQLLEREHEWVRVRLSNGVDGWLPERDVGRL